VRNDLKAVASVSAIQTDLDEQTCTFKLDASVDAEKLLTTLAEKNSKLLQWKITN